MNQLDEAIRAHLELKRKHGASEEELQAEEQEALGPVRREPPAQQPDEPAELSPELDVGQGVESSEAYDEPPVAGPHSYDEPPVLAPHFYDEPPVPAPHSYDEPLPPESFHEPLDPLAEPGFDQPVETAGDAAEPMAPGGGDTPPRGFDAVEEPPREEDEEGEDVLEETPDFLQETPEHDRLWFEQKPPRDFDFDE